jgi:hypothetical protein
LAIVLKVQKRGNLKCWCTENNTDGVGGVNAVCVKKKSDHASAIC